jgi:hypothetical protein
MAISTLKNRESYESGANQTSFDFTVSGVKVPFFANSDIKVFKRASGETADTELTFNASPSSNAQFSITAVNNDTRQGGTIVLGGTGYAAGTTITIERVVPFTQEYTLQEGSAIDPTALNTALDRTVAQTQQLDDDRSVTFPASDASSVTYNITESAASRASKVLGFDSSGNVNTQTFSSVAGDAVSGGDGIDITANSISVDNSTDFTFNAGKLALATDSVDSAEIKADAVDTAEIKDNAVTTAKVLNSNITKAKIENVANMRVLGNTSGSAVAPQEVSILDEDNMASNSATSLATQQSIKAYVDLYKPNVAFAAKQDTQSEDGTENQFYEITGLNPSLTTKVAGSTFKISTTIALGSEDLGNNNVFKVQYSLAGASYADFLTPTSPSSRVACHAASSQGNSEPGDIVTTNFDVYLSGLSYTAGQSIAFKVFVAQIQASSPKDININRSHTDTDDNDHARAVSTMIAQEIYA